MQLKRFLQGIALSLCLVALSVAYVGCDKPEQQINYIALDASQSVLTVEQDTTLQDLVLVINGMYPDSTEINIDWKKEVEAQRLTLQGFDTSTPGDIQVTISYKVADGKDPIVSKPFTITVTPKIQDIEYKSGLNMVIEKDSQPSLANLKITVNYVGGTSREVSYDPKTMQVRVDTSVAGTNIPLTITYKGKTITLNVTVKALESLEYVSGLGDAYQFLPYDTSAVTVDAVYTDGSRQTLTAANPAVHVSSIDTTSYDPQTVKVSYMGKETAGLTINVVELVDIDYVSGIQSVIPQNAATIVYNNLVLSGIYDDGEEKTLNYVRVKDYLTFSGVNTANVGDQVLVITLTYDTTVMSTTCNITVATDNGVITKFSDPKFVSDLIDEEGKNIHNTKNTHVTTFDGGKTGFEHVYGETGYTDYYVGSQNAWIFMPKVLSKGHELTTIHTDVKVFLNDSTTALTEEQLAQYVEIDNLNYQTYQFTQEANGNKFKIEVRPYGYESNPLYADMMSEFTFKVIDGYNVYNTADLRMLDNTYASKWATWDAAHGITQVVNTHGLVLQNDINITDADVPAVHFWTEEEATAAGYTEYGIVGSLKDHAEGELGFFYQHTITDGSTYRFEGNYYQISVEDISLIERESNSIYVYKNGKDGKKEYITAHSNIFGFYGPDEAKYLTSTEPGEFIINNLQLKGNCQKSDTPEYSGGIIAFKSTYVKTTMNNVLSQRFYIPLFANQGGATRPSHGFTQEYADKCVLTLNSVNAFDSYNTIIYSWGGRVIINDSHLLSAGGPVMICDHAWDDEYNQNVLGGITTNVTASNSALESWVTGTEGWFVTYKATSEIAKIKAMVKLLSDYGKNTIREDGGFEYVNMIAVYKNTEVQGMTDCFIRGTFDVVTNDTTTNVLDFDKCNAKDGEEGDGEFLPTTYKAIAKQLLTAGLLAQGKSQAEADATATYAINNAPFIATPNNAWGVMGADINTQGELTGTSWVLQPTDTATYAGAGNMAQAQDYATVYLPNGMGAILGLYDAA